ncbi:MAG: DUF3108 domain-containing protein [Prevotella sp.]|nr:DUF3108 domain-containing protein [Prevotella sp.]
MKRYAYIFAALMLSLSAHGQQSLPFQGGEYLSYNLYYNWQFVWLKAGTASMSTVETKYKGQTAYRASLITRGNSKADDVFVMRDTLISYVSADLFPLYYRKGAREGKRYYVDEVWYSYPDSKQCRVRQHQLTSKGKHENREQMLDHRVYDMLGMFMRARSFDPSKWQKGHTIDFDMVDGHKVESVQLKYLGKSTVKADDGKKYRCLQLSYIENEEGKKKEIVRFYVTDDLNHIPIRLDMFLRFGSAKAFLSAMRGNRNAVEAQLN